MRVAALCYHSQNIQGNSYELNDHVAFAHDLASIVERNIPIISIEQLVQHLNGMALLDFRAAVVLTCDDGTTLDWFDYQHPEFGWQTSFNNIMRHTLGAQRCDSATSALMTSFVIACPVARRHIDHGCYAGEPLSDDSWWQEAASSGYWSIENHSWNHWHVSLPFQAPIEQPLGQFFTVDNYLQATKQIRQATGLINSKLGSAAQTVRYFAYPYGHAAHYLQHHYLPYYTAQHAIEAAFTTQADFVTEHSSLYALPRFVCGEAWKSSQQFTALLDRLVS
ncbi:MAG: polysaccharide deacetylase family protein [Pseudomonas sp.]|nr:polysaccharide deacetylase family protein [Pseudomonas sp.]